MEAKRNSENSETINLELVLEEFIKEQKSQTKSMTDLTLAISSLSERFTSSENEILKLKNIPSTDNNKTFQEIIKKVMSDIHFFISTQQQKPVINKYQLLLFPEQDAKQLYKIVFGRWFLWITIMLLFTNAYKFSIHWSDNQREIESKSLENNRINHAWFLLYSIQNKSLKKLMDTAYARSYILDH